MARQIHDIPRRRSVRFHACRTSAEAAQHKTFIVKQIERLSAAGQGEFVGKLLKRSAQAEPNALARVKQGVDTIFAGQFKRPTAPSDLTDLPDGGPTFSEFERRWTSGELRKEHRDYVAEKRSVQEDIYRLDAHVYPLVGDVHLREFTVEHAEAVMRALPEGRSPATRRHVAQLMSRVLELAVILGNSRQTWASPRTTRLRLGRRAYSRRCTIRLESWST